MDNKAKIEKANKLIRKFAALMKRAYMKHNYEKCLELIEASANFQYFFNQVYSDKLIEDYIVKISKNTILIDDDYKCDPDCVLFFDDFGGDIRGLVIIYLKALCKLGYKVVYITQESSRNNQKSLHSAVEGYNVIFEYYNSRNTIISNINFLNDCINRYKPTYMFMYGYPYNIIAAVVFTSYAEKIKRYQINLTDHAFWIGLNAFDYCLEFRDYGAHISQFERGISKDKLLLCPYYPIIDETIDFKGFPFKRDNKKVLFSGGGLYKTIGDNNKYYTIVSSILSSNSDVIFLYAGEGNATYLNELVNKYPQRVFHIEERKDFFAILKRIDLYLNTYPMLGGLMTQYAVVAGVIPLTLKHGDDSSGLLLEQDEAQIEYSDINYLIKDALKLLSDEHYMSQRKALLKNQVITEIEFQNNLKNIMEFGKSNFTIKNIDLNTLEFRRHYVDRLLFYNEAIRSIVRFNHKKIIINFPFLFIFGVIKRLFQKTKG